MQLFLLKKLQKFSFYYGVEIFNMHKLIINMIFIMKMTNITTLNYEKYLLFVNKKSRILLSLSYLTQSIFNVDSFFVKQIVYIRSLNDISIEALFYDCFRFFQDKNTLK